jgi:hypothetical protein
MSMDAQRSSSEDLWRTLQQVAEWIRFADAKAGAVVAADGVMIAFYAGRLDKPGVGLPAKLALSGALLIAALSALFAVMTVAPRARRVGATSALHYDVIAAHPSASAFHGAAMTLHADRNRFDEALTNHVWTLANIAKRKYTYAAWAIRIAIGAFTLGLVGLLA